jgi:hypothetical protein
MKRALVAGGIGSGIAVGLCGAILAPGLAELAPWVMYPMFPGLAMMIFITWVTQLNFGANEVVVRGWVTLMNTVFYGWVCYVAIWLVAALRPSRREP